MVNWTWHVGIEVLKADEVHMRKRRPHRERGGKKSITTNVLFRFQKEGQGTRLFHVLLSQVPPYEMNDLPHSPKYISVEIRSKANTSVANLNRVWLWACKSILRLASNSSEKLRTDIDPEPTICQGCDVYSDESRSNQVWCALCCRCGSRVPKKVSNLLTVTPTRTRSSQDLNPGLSNFKAHVLSQKLHLHERFME